MIARVATIAAVLVAWAPAHADEQAIRDSAVARAMKAELARAMTLSLPDAAKPYYVAYTVTDVDQVSVTAEFGGTVASKHSRNRHLQVDVRVGDHALDNSNFLVFDLDLLQGMAGHSLALDDDYALLRRQIWLGTDSAYKGAASVLEKKKAVLSGKAAGEHVDDFAKAKPVEVIVAEEPAAPDAARYEALAKRLAAVLRDFPIEEGGVMVRAFVAKRYFADSAGGFTFEPRTLVAVSVACRTQADDGMNVMNHGSVVVPSAAELPGDAELEAEVRRVATELMEIRKAPAAEAYSGPVLFEGPAAAQLMRELLAKNLGGTPAPKLSESRYAALFARLGLETELGDKVGKPILPATFTVNDDPGLHAYKGAPLVGAYRVDGEGVPAQKVRLVAKGKLLGFLMSRTPRKDFPTSNGHGRAGPTGARAQISNLVIEASRGLPEKRLRQRLLREAKAAGEDYAVIVRLLDDTSITSSYAGGSSAAMLLGMARGGAAALPAPLVAVKVTPDGKEEYLRGLSLGGLTPRSLKQILATGNAMIVHNHAQAASGVDAASAFTGGSGGMGALVFPTSVVTPAVLFGDVELSAAKGPKAKPPVLPRP